jgi:broad specificity phosphatase PhoE
MTTILLVRHASHDFLGRVLTGRTPGVFLSAQGLREAGTLAMSFAGEPIVEIHSSPRERALQTAEPIAAHLGLRTKIVPALDELDYGEWAGRCFAELASDPHWHRWNAQRGSSCPPRGETMRAVQDRVLAHLEFLRLDHPGAIVALVTHAEVIRAVLLYARAIPLDLFHTIEVPPASVSRLELSSTGRMVLKQAA